MVDNLKQGLIQVYTGDSKGKSTAAFGLVSRAIGHNLKCYIIQFMKGSSYYGELTTWSRLYPLIEYSQYGRVCSHSNLIRQGESDCLGCGNCFVRKGAATPEDRKGGLLALKKAKEVFMRGEHDVVVLDELNNALFFELITWEEVEEILNLKPEKVEVIITGRNAPPELIERADLVTEMKMIKHPFEKGIPSRRGIEY